MPEPGNQEGLPQPEQPEQPKESELQARREAYLAALDNRFSYRHENGTPYTSDEVQRTIADAQLEVTDRLVGFLGKSSRGEQVPYMDFEEAVALMTRTMGEEYQVNHTRQRDAQLDTLLQDYMVRQPAPPSKSLVHWAISMPKDFKQGQNLENTTPTPQQPNAAPQEKPSA